MPGSRRNVAGTGQLLNALMDRSVEKTSRSCEPSTVPAVPSIEERLPMPGSRRNVAGTGQLLNALMDRSVEKTSRSCEPSTVPAVPSIEERLPMPGSRRNVAGTGQLLNALMDRSVEETSRSCQSLLGATSPAASTTPKQANGACIRGRVVEKIDERLLNVVRGKEVKMESPLMLLVRGYERALDEELRMQEAAVERAAFVRKIRSAAVSGGPRRVANSEKKRRPLNGSTQAGTPIRCLPSVFEEDKEHNQVKEMVVEDMHDYAEDVGGREEESEEDMVVAEHEQDMKEKNSDYEDVTEEVEVVVPTFKRLPGLLVWPNLPLLSVWLFGAGLVKKAAALLAWQHSVVYSSGIQGSGSPPSMAEDEIYYGHRRLVREANGQLRDCGWACQARCTVLAVLVLAIVATVLAMCLAMTIHFGRRFRSTCWKATAPAGGTLEVHDPLFRLWSQLKMTCGTLVNAQLPNPHAETVRAVFYQYADASDGRIGASEVLQVLDALGMLRLEPHMTKPMPEGNRHTFTPPRQQDRATSSTALTRTGIPRDVLVRESWVPTWEASDNEVRCDAVEKTLPTSMPTATAREAAETTATKGKVESGAAGTINKIRCDAVEKTLPTSMLTATACEAAETTATKGKVESGAAGTITAHNPSLGTSLAKRRWHAGRSTSVSEASRDKRLAVLADPSIQERLPMPGSRRNVVDTGQLLNVLVDRTMEGHSQSRKRSTVPAGSLVQERPPMPSSRRNVAGTGQLLNMLMDRSVEPPSQPRKQSAVPSDPPTQQRALMPNSWRTVGDTGIALVDRTGKETSRSCEPLTVPVVPSIQEHLPVPVNRRTVGDVGPLLSALIDQNTTGGSRFADGTSPLPSPPATGAHSDDEQEGVRAFTPSVGRDGKLQPRQQRAWQPACTQKGHRRLALELLQRCSTTEDGRIDEKEFVELLGKLWAKLNWTHPKQRLVGHWAKPHADTVEPARTERILARPFTLFWRCGADCQDAMSFHILPNTSGNRFLGVTFQWFFLFIQVLLGAISGVGPYLASDSAAAINQVLSFAGVTFLWAAVLLIFQPCACRLTNALIVSQCLSEGAASVVLLLAASDGFALRVFDRQSSGVGHPDVVLMQRVGFIMLLLPTFIPIAQSVYDGVLVLFTFCARGVDDVSGHGSFRAARLSTIVKQLVTKIKHQWGTRLERDTITVKRVVRRKKSEAGSDLTGLAAASISATAAPISAAASDSAAASASTAAPASTAAVAAPGVARMAAAAPLDSGGGIGGGISSDSSGGDLSRPAC